MKNILALLLGLVLTLALLFISFDVPFFDTPPSSPSESAGTEPTDPIHTDPTPGPTSVPGTDPVILDLPMSAIVLTDHAEQSRDENGTVYFSYAYPNVRLYLSDEVVSEAVTLDLLNRIDSTRTQADAVRADAASTGTISGFYQLQYLPQRIDGAVLSLSGTMTSFSGGAHPGSTCTGVTYDLLTGNSLTLDDILTDDCTADVLCRMVVDALSSINQNDLLYSDFSISVEERFSGYFLADDSWFLSREGLCFSFEPYEVGPYSSGIITAVIPYGQLPGYLEDRVCIQPELPRHPDPHPSFCPPDGRQRGLQHSEYFFYECLYPAHQNPCLFRCKGCHLQLYAVVGSPFLQGWYPGQRHCARLLLHPAECQAALE